MDRLPGVYRIPEYAAVGLRPPQTQVQVCLEGLGAALDVTFNHVAVALRPFTIGLCLNPLTTRAELERARLSLVFRERSPREPQMGRIELAVKGMIPLGAHSFWLFETTDSVNDCLPAWQVRLNEWARWWRGRKSRNPYNFRMIAAERRSIDVFYGCPRPVVLVSTAFEDASNIFPMDLIGPVDAPYFLMALRNTSPSIRLMQGSRRMSLSSVPHTLSPVVYDLGKHHRKERIDWTSLPFRAMPSPLWGLPVPESALAVRDVQVEQWQVVGSHTLFVTTVAREQTMADAPHLFHISGLYQQSLARRGRAL
ncbi:MAG: hypothetical protein HY259_05970 [Chloroflexi bacterium]|nr:hypothetical protein [Chloroflexota bacterium]